MKFFRIEMLFLIWTVPLLLLVFILGIKKRTKILTGFASARGLAAIAPRQMYTRRRWIKTALILPALFFMAVALSGPQYGYRWQEIERKGIDIIIALDCSRSMLATDIKPSRLDRAKREVFDLLGMLKGDRVGLVAFAGTAFLQCPLTIDYEAFYLFLNVLSPEFLPVGGTDIPGAVITALSGFNHKDNSAKAVILITDGESTTGDPMSAAEKAKAAGVKLFTIGVGKDDGVPVPNEQGGFKKDASGKIVITRLDEGSLKKMALLTGGTYVRSVAGDMDLDAVYNSEIRGKMDVSTLSSGRKQVWEDRYQWFLILALVMLIADLLLPSTTKAVRVPILLLALVCSPSLALASDVYQSIQKGLEAYQSQDYEAALKYFIDAQLEDPDRSEILYNIGSAYYKLGDFNAALENYSHVLNSENKSIKHKALYNRGNANYRMNKLEDAISDYEAALKIDPGDQEARQNLDFVKKKIKMQEKQQHQQSSNNKNKPGEQGKTFQDRPENRDQTKEKSDDSSPGAKDNDESSTEYGQSMDAPEQDDIRPQKGSSEKEKKDKDSKAAASLAESAPNRDKTKQAERMLNRLRDMPGKAMIPVYREQRVEKDW
jgi:Ca-activated chloride channel family protein